MYSVLSLGVLPDYTESSAESINNNGDVVCSAGGKLRDFQQAFLWQNGKQTDLGTLGGETCGADKINDAGQIFGAADTRAGDYHAFVWHNGQMRDLDASGLRVANLWNNLPANLPDQAARVAAAPGACAVLCQDGQIRDLRDLLHGQDHEVTARSDSGQAAGIYCPGTDRREQRPFWFDGMRAYSLPSLGGIFSHANALNNRGATVGFSNTRADEDSPTHACLWQNGHAYDLDTQNTDHSAARGINDWGQVVGMVTSEKDWQHAVLWDDGRMIDLNAQIPPDSGWILNSAKSINKSGQIVGDGLLRGQKRAFLLTPTS